MKLVALIFFSLLGYQAALADTIVTKRVDTGSHTCTRQGQEAKVDDSAEAGADRYFVEDQVSFSEISRFGVGSCEIVGIQKRKVKVKLENGGSAEVSLPYQYNLRAYADCTNNPAKFGSRISTECQFSGQTQEFK